MIHMGRLMLVYNIKRMDCIFDAMIEMPHFSTSPKNKKKKYERIKKKNTNAVYFSFNL